MTARCQDRRSSRRAFLRCGVRFVGLSLSAALLSGCREINPIESLPTIPTRAPVRSVSQERAEMTIALPLDADADLLPLRYLLGTELFHSPQLEVRVMGMADPSEALAALLSERAQAIWLDVPNTAKALSRNVNLVGIFQFHERDTSAILSLEANGPRVASDLKGRTIGVADSSSPASAALAYALSSAGLRLSDVSLVFSKSRLGRVLLDGVAVAIAGSATLAAWLGAQQVATRRLVLDEWPAIPGPTLSVLRPENSRERTDARRLVQALRQGFESLIGLPTDYLVQAPTMLASGGESAGFEAQAQASLDLLVARSTDRPFGWIDAGQLDSAEGLLRKIGWLAKDISLGQAFTNEFLKESL